jgi:hypothetical protein
VSIALTWGLVHPFPFLAAVLLVLAAVGWQAWRTHWRPPAPRPLRRPRAGGQILRASGRVYRDHLLTFVGIGAIFIPIAVVEAAFQWLLFHLKPLAAFVSLDGPRGVATVVLALLIGAAGGIAASAAVTAAVAAALDEIETERYVTARRAFARAWRHALAIALATAWQVLRSLLLILTVVGIPLAVYRFMATSLFAQASVLEDRTARDALQASAELTRGRWWRTFAFTIIVNTVAILSGPLLGVGILLLTSSSLTFIDITGSLIYALTVPLAATALTLYYFDLDARRQTTPA